MMINNIQVTITGDPISQEELSIYLDQIQTKLKRRIVTATVGVQGEFVDVRYKLLAVPFERIRRITGYLVGTTTRWNNAKISEEKDRVKHG